MKYIVLLVASVLSVLAQSDPFAKLIYDEFNRVRAQQNPRLPAIRWSPELAKVAQYHTNDLNRYRRANRNEQCNLHTWYGTYGCCYTPSHSNPNCMWDKTKQLSRYPDVGFEIAYDNGAAHPRRDITAAKVIVKAFMDSPPHRAVIISRNAWSRQPWMALGVANTGTFTTAWFGKVTDPASLRLRSSLPPPVFLADSGISLKDTGLPKDVGQDRDYSPKDYIPDGDYKLPSEYKSITSRH